MADLKVERLWEIALGDTANLPLQHIATHLPAVEYASPRKASSLTKGVATEGWAYPELRTDSRRA